MFALILAYYSRTITLYNTVIQYNNDSIDLQKAAKINVTLRYPLEKFMCYTKHHKKNANKFILSSSILDWFDSLSCQSWLGISKIWEMAKSQIDPKEKTLTWQMSNYIRHSTASFYSAIPHYLLVEFLHQKYIWS